MMTSPDSRKELEHEVVVVGAGSAGIAAAVASARNGADTLLVESGATLGGDLISGLPIDGCRSTGGDWIVGGVAAELFDECRAFGGYVGSIFDRRNICVVMVNPRVMGFAVLRLLKKYGVGILPYTQAIGLAAENGRVAGLELANKTVRLAARAELYLDCTGDADLAVMAGLPFETGEETQPASMTFQFRGLDSRALLEFVRDHPENCGLGENPLVRKTAPELARELYEEGIPKVFFSGEGPLIKAAVESGELFPCSMLALNPNSPDYTCVTVNTTRMVLPDNTGGGALGEAMLALTDQVVQAAAFVRKRIPGFAGASFDGVAPRLGIRESRRIVGEYRLGERDVAEGIKRGDGVCKGGHEIDVHGRDRDHVRLAIRNAGSYDIPLGCLLPKGMANLLAAGRSLSSDRVANSSARVMGTCMGMGQAAGTAAALCAKGKILPRELDIGLLRGTLREQGAILDGTP
ncbi:MAG: FAD-dependent oxidoreductase [Planctomycetota bacterium]|jgi:hypothetical protein|nr:FAD-dependent oxidoreductase [Planctomycetota bacterium]